MAEKARDLGHEYFALTDHSPRLKVANGLSTRAAARAARRRRGAERGARAVPHPHRRRGRHPRRRRARPVDEHARARRRRRRERALEAAHGVGADDAAHGRRDREPARRRARPLHRPAAHRARPPAVGVRRRRRASRRADAFDTALESQLPARAARPAQGDAAQGRRGRPASFTISTDAHATDQLEWQAYGTDRAAECGVAGRARRQHDDGRRPARLVRIPPQPLISELFVGVILATRRTRRCRRGRCGAVFGHAVRPLRDDAPARDRGSSCCSSRCHTSTLIEVVLQRARCTSAITSGRTSIQRESLRRRCAASWRMMYATWHSIMKRIEPLLVFGP